MGYALMFALSGALCMLHPEEGFYLLGDFAVEGVAEIKFPRKYFPEGRKISHFRRMYYFIVIVQLVKPEVDMMYMAMTVAKYIVSKCTREHTPVSNLQLQKILYFVQKESLLYDGGPIFADEIEAWQFGPVVPNVYFHFSGFGAMPIVMEYETPEFEEEEEELIDDVVARKKMLYPWDLVEETHKTGGAWDQIYCGGRGNRQVIPLRLIAKVG